MKAHLLAAPAARASHARLVWHVRDILQPGWLLTAFRITGGLVADRIVCISEATARPLRHGRARRRIRVVHNGVSPRRVSPDETAAWRRRLGAADGDRLVGMVGQIAHWKGQDIFLDAAARLAARRGDARFVVAGDCLFPENEAAFLAELHHRTERGPLHGRATLLGPVDDVDGLMSALDVAVHASRLAEPFGRVIIEAMGQGTPVVTTTIGAGPELVVAGAGRLVPPEDPEMLAAAINDLLSTRDATAARRAAARFTPQATAAGVMAVWQELEPTRLDPG
jgi:glycosyltransferase involved in cell wall biosynthesis